MFSCLYSKISLTQCHHLFRKISILNNEVTDIAGKMNISNIPLGPFGNAVADLLRWTVATAVLFAGVGVRVDECGRV